VLIQDSIETSELDRSVPVDIVVGRHLV